MRVRQCTQQATWSGTCQECIQEMGRLPLILGRPTEPAESAWGPLARGRGAAGGQGQAWAVGPQRDRGGTFILGSGENYFFLF